MQFGSVDVVANPAPVAQPHPSEHTERGPDRDNGGDEVRTVSPSAALSTPNSGHGGSVNIPG